MIDILRSPALASLLGCLLYLATTATILNPGRFAGARAATRPPPPPEEDPSWKFRNPDFEQWLEELKQEKAELSQRERDLRELQERVEAERTELLSLTQAVSQVQRDFDQNVVRFQQQQVENLKKQTKIISGMTPDGAAKMLKEMPEDEVVRILFTLKPEGASLILDSLSKMGNADAKRAAALTERLRVALPPGPGQSKPTPN